MERTGVDTTGHSYCLNVIIKARVVLTSSHLYSPLHGCFISLPLIKVIYCSKTESKFSIVLQQSNKPDQLHFFISSQLICVAFFVFFKQNPTAPINVSFYQSEVSLSLFSLSSLIGLSARFFFMAFPAPAVSASNANQQGMCVCVCILHF